MVVSLTIQSLAAPRLIRDAPSLGRRARVVDVTQSMTFFIAFACTGLTSHMVAYTTNWWVTRTSER